MTFNFKHLLAVAALAVSPVAMSAQSAAPDGPKASVHASVDSAVLTMGDRTMLRVEIVKTGHEGALVDLPKAEPGKVLSYGGVEVRDMTVDSTSLPNGRTQLNYNFLIQPFDPGTLQLPPFKYAVGTDTFASEPVSMKVNEPQMPQEMRDSLWINPMAGTVSIPGRWYDFIPSWWYWVLISAALIALAVVVWQLYRKNGPTLLPKRRIIPPYEVAMRRLGKLKSRRLAESGNEKEYYTELTDILRQYLGGRFGIFALEMSSTQILEDMSNNKLTKDYTSLIRPLLETADFVKFAKVRPTPDENVRSFSIVETFVNETKPVEEEPEEEKGKKAKSGKGKKAKKSKKQ